MKRILLLIFFSQIATAQLTHFEFEGVRQTGMGNAGIAIADDANALWYNPAGLSQIKKVHFDLFDFTLGADSLDSLNRMQNAIFHGNYSNMLRPNSEFLRFNVTPTLAIPNFALSLFETARGFFDLQNLTSPNLSSSVQVTAHNDLGAIAGISIPLLDVFSVGFSVRAFERTGLDVNLTAQDLINQTGTSNPTTLLNNLYSSLKDMAGTGTGIGLNTGVLAHIPLRGKAGYRLNLGATVEDVGTLRSPK